MRLPLYQRSRLNNFERDIHAIPCVLNAYFCMDFRFDDDGKCLPDAAQIFLISRSFNLVIQILLIRPELVVSNESIFNHVNNVRERV